MQDHVRLHISPFSEELLPMVLGSSLTTLASKLSFHQVPTFPERPFGFVELPVMEAAKLKKKINGTILKGKKMKIEEARKDKRRVSAEEEDTVAAEDVSSRKLRKSERKRGREDGVLEGYELPEGRKVKRGWTEPVESSKRKGSKRDRRSGDDKAMAKRPKPSAFTDGPECLFQAKMPTAATTSEESGTKTSRRKKKGPQNHVVVHEFEKSEKKPSFINVGSNATMVESVQEPVKDTEVIDELSPEARPRRKTRHGSNAEKPQTTLNYATKRKSKPVGVRRAKQTESGMDVDKTSSSTSSQSEAEDDPEITSNKASTSPRATPAVEVTQSSPTTAEPHPLETLFKRPKPPTSNPSGANNKGLEVKIPFSFFGNEETGDGIEKSMETPGLSRTKRGKASGLPNLSIPVTPYTQRDMQWRSQRSAAPTPDTAAPGKSGFGEVWNRLHEDREDDIEEEEEEMFGELNGEEDQAGPSNPKKRASGSEDKEESEFTKWFWENRGDNNRAWKKKRREAAREQRQRENKRRKKAT
ncbi:hypothetical protein MMC10_010421 [Thelotrema lepadinum]|nr:hypothetical protein [Thelotrema lepadinum]